MFENQTEEGEEEEVIYERDNKEYWFTLQEGKKSLQRWSISNARASNNSSFFLVCFAMVQAMLSLWSLFIESLGSYSRCRVSNGVMPCLLGPTSFYLKIWVNILIIRWTSKCCCVLDDPHLGSSWSSFGFIMYEWTHELLGVSYEFLGNNQSMGFSSYIRKLLS